MPTPCAFVMCPHVEQIGLQFFIPLGRRVCDHGLKAKPRRRGNPGLIPTVYISSPNASIPFPSGMLRSVWNRAETRHNVGSEWRSDENSFICST